MDVGPGIIVAVTGAGHGIGYYTALAFAKRGARVVMGDIDQKNLDIALSDFRPHGHDVHGIQIDVTKDTENLAFAEFTKELAEDRKIILVNNAGILLHGRLDETPVNESIDLFSVNIFGAMSNVNAFVPMMRSKGGGHIVNIASVMGLVTAPDVGVYAASKHALHAYTQTLRLELAPLSIGVSGIYPGAVTTGIINNMRRVGASAQAESAIRDAFVKRAITTPDVVGERVVRAVERNKGTVVIGRDAVIGAALARVSPSLARKITSWIVQL